MSIQIRCSDCGADSNSDNAVVLCGMCYSGTSGTMAEMRMFIREIYRAEEIPAWAHDAAAKLLGMPSLAHGFDDNSKEVKDE